MDYNHVIVKFCERRLNPEYPEYYNASSALYISAIAYYNIIKNDIYIKKNASISITIIYWCIFFNGVSSFLYHWYAWYIFKLFDEYTMIIPIWFGTSKILIDLKYNPHYVGLHTIFNIAALVLDVFPWFDTFFPLYFTSEMILIAILYLKAVKQYGDSRFDGLNGLLLCSASGISWVASEQFCSENVLFGHVIWHVGMSTGICYIIGYFKEINVSHDQIEKGD